MPEQSNVSSANVTQPLHSSIFAQIGGVVIALILANTIFLNIAQQKIAHVPTTADPRDKTS